jgi:isoaspartyl peptidase/L-asparaginase-like protein (Ntn-hydrolase superfamily)
LDRLTKAAGGVICVDASGHIGMAHTTEHMPYAFIDAAGLRQSGL